MNYFLCQEYILKGKVSPLYEYSKIWGGLLILDIHILHLPIKKMLRWIVLYKNLLTAWFLFLGYSF